MQEFTQLANTLADRAGEIVKKYYRESRDKYRDISTHKNLMRGAGSKITIFDEINLIILHRSLERL